MAEEAGIKCCQCDWIYPQKIYAACTNSDCMHKFCVDCEFVTLRDTNKGTDVKDQPIPYVNFDMDASSSRALPASNSMISEGLPSLAPLLAFNEPLQTSSTLLSSEQIVFTPEHSASGQDEKPVDGDWFWTCHNCNEGPWLYALVEACQTCGHVRCTACIFEER